MTHRRGFQNHTAALIVIASCRPLKRGRIINLPRKIGSFEPPAPGRAPQEKCARVNPNALKSVDLEASEKHLKRMHAVGLQMFGRLLKSHHQRQRSPSTAAHP